MDKKQGICAYSGENDKRDWRKISKEKEIELEEYFIMDGITPNQAAKLTGITRPTVKLYFDMWAEELISEPDHETWAYRMKRVRVRSLEGYTKKIIKYTSRREMYDKMIFQMTHIEKKTKDEKTGEETVEFVLKSLSKIPHNKVLSYEGKLQTLDNQLILLQNLYDAMDAQAPGDILLKQEILATLNDIQSN